MRFLRLALAQINSIVGDINGNSRKIIDHVKRAVGHKADIVVFPELAVTGYPPEDLLLKPRFIADNLAAIEDIGRHTNGITAIVGFVDSHKNKGIYNAAAVISEGRIVDVYHKIFLPNYGVFDEFRYFLAAKRFPVYSLNGTKFGINICEDIWYGDGPARIQSLAGAEVVININASPYESGKPEKRERILAERSVENDVIIAYLNAVGGQDELVFDGFSMIVTQSGRILARGKQFQEDLMIVDLDLEPVRSLRKKRDPAKALKPPKKAGAVEMVWIPAQKKPGRKPLKQMIVEPLMRKEEEYYGAISLGTSDYVRKNDFRSVVIGLSGGIDSSLVAVIAVDAIGRDNVKGLFMPSSYTSRESREDAFQLAENLGIEIIEIPIDEIMEGYLRALEGKFSGME